MDRAADFESVGREFESPQARHVFNQALSRQAGNPVTLSAAMAFEASVLGDCQLHPRPPGVEALERFVRWEPLRRVHECVFGVLALESEPVDPRL